MALRVAIVGGGIGGLAAGIALTKRGFAVTVYERAPELREVGAGLGIWANGLRALDALGLAAPFRAMSAGSIEGAVRTWRGRLLTQVSSSQLQKRYGEPQLIVHRAELLDVLRKGLGEDGLLLGRACVSFTQTPRDVTLRFADDSTATHDLLIGADGLHSVVRQQLWNDGAPRYSGYTSWRGVLPFDHARLLPGETWGPGARFGQLPLTDGRVYWFATKNVPPDTRFPGGDKVELTRLFAAWHAPIPDLIAATPERAILRTDICDRAPRRVWGRGLVTLLGDAAHPMTPNLGQGACQALEDAVVLARCLAESAADPAKALRAYERRRAARTGRLVVASERAGRVGQLENPVASFLRNGLVKTLAGPLQTRALDATLGFDFMK